MRAVDLKVKAEIGTPASALYVNEHAAEPRDPGEDEAVVRVHAFGLNRMDIMQRQGQYPLPPGAPATLGVEFAGTVVRFGPKKHCHGDHLEEGDKVFGLVVGGAYAEYVTVSRFLLAKYADSAVSFDDIAGVPETWFTATQALHMIAGVEEKRPQSVLVHAGASGVGIALIQIASLYADEIFATVGSPEKVQFVQSLGKSVGAKVTGICYRTEDFADVIKAATNGRGVDVVVDFVGKDYFTRNIDVAAVEGRIVMLSLMSGREVYGVQLGPLLYKRLRIEGSTLRARPLEYQIRLKDTFTRAVWPHLQSGKFKNPVDKVFSWHQVDKAHEYMESNQSTGKILCLVD
ncbi:uncharacterized protein V1510DRAFT_423973 [Dipodascopsis tothii]|uniref:uncharacterized protein n=1 Tax=Dipodascopsis tothii TaxID=44089 RepID=UPI0034CEFC74